MTFPEFGRIIKKAPTQQNEFPEFGRIIGKVQEDKYAGLSPRQKFSQQTEEFAQKLIEPGARVVKGMARAAGHLPATVASLPAQLINLITAGKVPGLPQAASYLNQPLAWEPALEQQLQKTISPAQTPGQQTLESGGEQLMNLLSFGVNPQAALPAVLGGKGAEAGIESLSSLLTGQRPSETTKEIAGFAGQLPGLLRGSLTAAAKTPIVQESGLALPQVAAREGRKFGVLKPKVFAGRKEKAMENVTKQSEKLINDIRKKSIPISKEIEEGIDVGARNEANFEKVSEISSKISDKYESKPISDYLVNIKENILKTPIPTNEQEDILKLVDKYQSKFGEIEGGKHFYTPKEYLSQFRNINNDIKNLYQTKFVHGDRLDTMHFYEGLKNSISDTFENNAPKEFSDLFKETNKEYSSLKKLEKFNDIVESFSNEEGALVPRKLEAFLSNHKKVNILNKQIGEKGTSQLKLISKDLSKATKNLDLIESSNLSNLITSHIGAGILKWLRVPFVAPFKIGKDIIEYGRGYLLTQPQAQRDVANLLKAIRADSPKAVKAFLIKLNEHANQYEVENPRESKVFTPEISD